jgi:hypothetical protein
MHFALADEEIDTLQNGLIADIHVQVLDFQRNSHKNTSSGNGSNDDRCQYVDVRIIT